MISRKIQQIVFILFFPVLALFPDSERDPFTVSIEVEEGENVIGWETAIFGKEEKKGPVEEKDDSDEKEITGKESEKELVAQKPAVVETKTEEPDAVLSKESAVTEKSEKNEENYTSKDPEWGRYYGDSKELTVEEKYKKLEEKQLDTVAVNDLPKVDEAFLVPIDLLLWSHSGGWDNPMINTGVKVSFMNMYSIVSIGTDFSDSLYRPLSLGLSAGGFYRMSDFSISADLGYEVVWDFGNNSSINDYALGLRAGLSYNIWSWFAISAGAGVNYSVLKDSNFENGRFIPMIFGGFEFNLIK